MAKRLSHLCVVAIFVFATHAFSQTTTGLVTGLVTDSAGAVVVGAQVDVTNQDTGVLRTGKSGDNGIYLLLQMPPGSYRISVARAGFATEIRQNVRLNVNQSVTVDFALRPSSSTQTITVTGAPPALNTTSPTLSTVIDHDEIVDLPLNQRQFTELAILVPGAAPEEDNQQSSYVVGGGISPTVDGQRGYQNNFTMDGTLNNQTYLDVWAIAPPPDAIEEFNVQSHITDAQFAISSGANINVVTRSGTNKYHGSLWEFVRNDHTDALEFPQTSLLAYRQNQYGFYLGGPVSVPHLFSGHDNTWFSAYWEGYRYSVAVPDVADTFTSAMESGNFSGVLGTTKLGTDCNGNPEYANEIYDPTTSVPDPCNPGEYIRTPFQYNGQLNVIPPSQINPAAPLILKEYYPLANVNVGEGVFPNYDFKLSIIIASDNFGFRLDHKFGPNDTAFLRLSRKKGAEYYPDGLPSVLENIGNYAQEATLGYTHIFNPKTLLNVRYGYTYDNASVGNPPSGAAFADSINFEAALPAQSGYQMGPYITISNGISGVSQQLIPFGPQEGMDYHVDLTKEVGHHSISGGVMYYHLRSNDGNLYASPAFTQNGTAQDGTAGPTGYGPASFMLGVVDSYSGSIGNTGADQTVNWNGLYAQDQWQATKKLVLTAGLRWDYVAPPNYHKIVSGLDVLNGQFYVTGAVAPYYSQAVGPKGFFYPQYNGYEPRLGASYLVTNRLVLHAGAAILDDHNNTLVQENQNIRLSWPNATTAGLTDQDIGIPQLYVNNLPSAKSLINGVAPYAGYGANPHNRIPYSIEYNFGPQYEISKTMVLKVDYVGSVSRFQYIVPNANTALTPGPGSILSREPYPQYGGPFPFSWNAGPASYNALQASLQKSLSSGLFFLASYTWSKSMDWASDPYVNTEENFYDLKREWGPSTYSLKNMFAFTSLYELPVGRGKVFLTHSNRFLDALVDNWNIGAIFTADSGQPFDVISGEDVANTGASTASERVNRIPGVDPYISKSQLHRTASTLQWLNPAAFSIPAPYTYGNESRDDLTGPNYWDVDCDARKNFHLFESVTLQMRAEYFNCFNHTNYPLPPATLDSSNFGIITSADSARIAQFAAKILF